MATEIEAVILQLPGGAKIRLDHMTYQGFHGLKTVLAEAEDARPFPDATVPTAVLDSHGIPALVDRMNVIQRRVAPHRVSISFPQVHYRLDEIVRQIGTARTLAAWIWFVEQAPFKGNWIFTFLQKWEAYDAHAQSEQRNGQILPAPREV